MTEAGATGLAAQNQSWLEELRPLELHYFRLPRRRWELMLIRLRQMGANAVSTALPWMWHQPQAGVFDMTGLTHPRRNLTDFIDSCADMDLPVILRVGPYLGDGLLGGGVPLWLLDQHPEIHARDSSRKPQVDRGTGAPIPSPEHPLYVKHVEDWYDKITETLISRQAPEGPIVALQVSGLPPSLNQQRGTDECIFWDYNPHVIRVLWPIWLRQAYSGVDELNAVWKSEFAALSDAVFPCPCPLPAPGQVSEPYNDAVRFARYTISRIGITYTHAMQNLGWKVSVLSACERETSLESLPAPHVVQIDSESPELGAGVRWAMQAPLRADGSPARQFWPVKANLMQMDKGTRQVEGAILVGGPQDREFRLPRHTENASVYRLLLDGQVVEIPYRIRKDTLYLKYLAGDKTGQTDLYIICEGPSRPLTGYLAEHFYSLLHGRAHILSRAGALCRSMAEAFVGRAATAPDTQSPAAGDLLAAERSLAEAEMAVRRAVASLDKLEQMVGDTRTEALASLSDVFDLGAFTRHQAEKLLQLRDDCEQSSAILFKAADAMRGLGSTQGHSVTIQSYQAAHQQGQAATLDAFETLSTWLRWLRTGLSSGELPPAAWPIQDRLTEILQSLTIK